MMLGKQWQRFELIPASRYPIPEGLKVKCGYVTVPESRSAPSGSYPGEKTLRIYVTLIHSLSDHPAPDPIFFLYGGPGGNTGGVLRMLKNVQFQDLFLRDHDLVIFDQRGSGFSEPALFAPEVDFLESEAFLTNFNTDERAEHFVSAALKVRQRFAQEKINVAAVNTPEIAADMDDIRLALGYEQINIYSISYGTRPALAAIRDFPDHLRSVILDSTVPIQVSQYAEAIPNASYAFERVFDTVASNPQDHAAYPNLREVFYDLAARLDKTPVVLPAQHPVSGEAVQLRLSGEGLTGLFCNDFYDSAAIKTMPARIYKAYQGDYQEFANFCLDMLKPSRSALPGYSMGMYFSINLCDDKVTPATADQITRCAQQFPAFKSLPFTEFHLGRHIATLGEKWGARQAGPAEAQPVGGDTPTLILAGEFDQNTPAFWGRLAGTTLQHSHYIEVPGSGHGVISAGPCVMKIMQEFWADPSKRPDDGCVKTPSGPRFSAEAITG